jgi:hypothetical protein
MDEPPFVITPRLNGDDKNGRDGALPIENKGLFPYTT